MNKINWHKIQLQWRKHATWIYPNFIYFKHAFLDIHFISATYFFLNSIISNLHNSFIYEAFWDIKVRYMQIYNMLFNISGSLKQTHHNLFHHLHHQQPQSSHPPGHSFLKKEERMSLSPIVKLELFRIWTVGILKPFHY